MEYNMYGPDQIANSMDTPGIPQELIQELIQLADDVSRWPWEGEADPIASAQAAADEVLRKIPPDIAGTARSTGHQQYIDNIPRPEDL